jgi:chemotaxis regulatin CheY-phosphate phosphatase CheZ
MVKWMNRLLSTLVRIADSLERSANSQDEILVMWRCAEIRSDEIHSLQMEWYRRVLGTPIDEVQLDQDIEIIKLDIEAINDAVNNENFVCQGNDEAIDYVLDQVTARWPNFVERVNRVVALLEKK